MNSLFFAPNEGIFNGAFPDRTCNPSRSFFCRLFLQVYDEFSLNITCRLLFPRLKHLFCSHPPAHQHLTPPTVLIFVSQFVFTFDLHSIDALTISRECRKCLLFFLQVNEFAASFIVQHPYFALSAHLLTSALLNIFRFALCLSSFYSLSCTHFAAFLTRTCPCYDQVLSKEV